MRPTRYRLRHRGVLSSSTLIYMYDKLVCFTITHFAHYTCVVPLKLLANSKCHEHNYRVLNSGNIFKVKSITLQRGQWVS